jgi:hypothetical protein
MVECPPQRKPPTRPKFNLGSAHDLIELAVVRRAHRLVLADAMQVKPRAISEPQEFPTFREP